MAESNYEKTKRACAQAFCETDHSALIERFGLEQDADYLYVRFFEQPFRLSKRTGIIERREECEAPGAATTPGVSVCAPAAPGAPAAGTTADASAVTPGILSSPTGAATPGAPEALGASVGAPTAGATASAATPGVSTETTWSEAQFNEAMTIYDLLGYAQPACHASKTMINMKSLHTKIAATAPRPSSIYAAQEARLAALEAQKSGILAQAAQAIGGAALNKADASAQFTVINDLTMQIQLWLPDEDFPASLQFFWDENVLQYMHYETVWYANGFILEELEAQCRKLLGTERETLPQTLPAKR